MKRFISISLLLFLLTFFTASSASAATITPVDGMSVVSVGVGISSNPVSGPESNARFSLFGKTSPGAHVTIQNAGIHNETDANADGYFEFNYLFLALFHEDICIVAQDTEHVTTPPHCIPPPGAATDTRIGPVLLPPTTTISQGNAYIGDTVTLTGQTIPNVTLELNLFTDEQKKGQGIALIPSAYAYTIPKVSLTSDSHGKYSLTLPTASSQFIRMFTKALYKGDPTPKGQTLVLDVFPVWMLLFKFFSQFWTLLRARLIELIILLQVYVLLMYFLHHYFTAKRISEHRKRALALVHGEITLTPAPLMVE